MKRALPHPLALAIIALALLPASASAKEVVKAQVCGAGECVDVSRTLAMDLMDGGPPTNPPKEAAPFFTARLWISVDDGKTERFDTVFVPRYELMRGADGTWMDPPVQTVAAFKRGASGLAASPASELGPLPAPTDAQVVEVVRPPADPAPVDDGSSAWPIAALGLAGAAAMWALALYVRRRRGTEGSSPAAPTPPGG
jgi:hypothetical protein